MFTPQNITEYLDNPMGKGSSALSERKLVRANLDQRYEALIKKHKDFKYTIYKTSSAYFFHFVIPSESERENDYDVVIYFIPSSKELKYDNFLFRYNLKFFSNSPSFVYTYGYVYNENGMFMNSLKSKYHREVLKNKPVQRNPSRIINYEKSLFFALTYLNKHRSLLNKSQINHRARKYIPEEFAKNIRDLDTIMDEIKKEDLKISREKERAKAAKNDEKAAAKNRATKEIKHAGSNNNIIKSTTSTGTKSGVKKISPKKSGVKKIK